MPRIVVSMKPFGSRSPGVISLAMTPAINPMMIVPRMCSMFLRQCRSAHRLANFQAEPHSEVKCLFLRGQAAEQFGKARRGVRDGRTRNKGKDRGDRKGP